MTTDEPIEQMIIRVAEMDRAQLVSRLQSFSEPRLDFDDAFLADLSVERLRHVLMAACLQARKKRASGEF